ncbi:MAG TPA: glycosyltransferase family A protein [Gaiella sp.]
MAEAASDLRFDLVVATVDRTDDLDALLTSLDAQTHRAFRVLVVDQNADDRVQRALAGHPGLETLRLRSPRGLSRARNAALPSLTADVVAFPDDDCLYVPDLLERVARRFAADPGLDGLCGRPLGPDGRSSGRWPSAAQAVTGASVLRTAISHTIFLRRRVVDLVGGFDEQLGLGAGTPWASGEEIDYLVRAVDGGARVEYDPFVVITHPVKRVDADELVALGRRDGGSVGYLLAANRYPPTTILPLLLRPLVATVAFAVLLDTARARFHLATLVGRLSGLAAGRRRPR